MNTLKTVTELENLEIKLQDVLTEVTKLKLSIMRENNMRVIPKNVDNITLDDFYTTIGKNRKSYIYRLKEYCKENEIDTLEQFVSVPPKEFICKKGIGTSTFRVVKKALENLGIAWIDNE